MRIKRREFLKYCIGSAAALGLDMSTLGKLEKALAADEGLPKVIWLNGANCTGCTISLANLVGAAAPKDVADLLVNTIDLVFHPNLMGAAGDLAVETLRNAASGNFILAVDGGIPTVFNGHTCILWSENGQEVSAKEAVQSLAPKAAAVLCIGTCAAFGGVPAGRPNPTQIRGVGELTGQRTVNIPGCPPHPDWIVGTIARLLAGEMPVLDDYGRPELFFKTDVHKVCPRKGREKVLTLGLDGECLKELGCRGPQTRADCPSRLWNNAANWCIGANAICLGCTENGFPDKFSPFYNIQYGYQTYEKPPDDETPNGQQALRITKAEWRKDKSELKVEGDGTPGAIVKVFDTDTGLILGAVSVNKEGRWKFTDQKPASVPSRIKAESNGYAVESLVKNAPTSGGTDPGQIEITKAVWDAEKQKLDVQAVEGNGSNTLTVRYGGRNYTMTYKADKNRYELKLVRICYDATVTVDSTSGAAASLPVTVQNGSARGFECAVAKK